MHSSDERGFRLSPLQRRLARLHRAGAPCFARCTVTLDGDLDRARLATALALVVERHEVLRTSLRPLPGLETPLQFVGPPGPLAAPVEEDLRDLAPPERATREREVLAREAADPRDLAAGPLRLRLLRTGRRTWTLAVTLPAVHADAATLDNFVAELARAYAGDAPAGADEETLQLADVCEWQHELEAEEPTPEAAAFWSRHLHPEGDAGAAGRFGVPERVAVEGEADMGALLDELAAATGAGQRAVLVAAWSLLLARWTGEWEVASGVLDPGRDLEPLRGLLGPVARVLPLRVEVDPEAPLARLAARTGELLAAAGRHADGLRWRTRDGRELARPADLCELAPPAPVFEAAGLRLAVRERTVSSDPFRLQLRLAPGEDVPVALWFDPVRVSRRRAHGMARGLAVLLTDAVHRPAAGTARLTVLGAGERTEVLSALRGDPPAEPAAVHELFRRQAARASEAVAVASGDGCLSYGELEARSDVLARRLVAAGVAPEDRVGLYLGRSLASPVAILGAWKAGAAFVALDPELPPHLLDQVVREADPVLVVTAGGRPNVLPAGVRTLPLESADGVPPADAVALPAADPDRLAYVVFTSGSTGRPKGILASHRGVASYLSHLLERHPPTPGQAVLQVAAPSFDASVRDLVGPLLGGARVEVARAEDAREPEALLALIRDRRISAVWSAVPTMLRAWLSSAPRFQGAAGLDTLLVSGEVLVADDVRRTRSVFGSALEVVNQYGPTECTLTSTYHAVPAAPPEEEAAAVPVGRPVAGCAVYVLDPFLEPVPPGAVGEVCIAGPGLARGYRGAPGATAAAFVPAPCGEDGERMYRTGDLGRLQEDGTLAFLGRRDAQVKIRGHRVEPEEVESHLAAHPDVLEAAVAVRDGGVGGPVLVAYPVLRPGRNLDPAAIRAFLEERLPAPSLPASFVALDRLPRTPTGKLQRSELPSPEGRQATGGADHQPPSTPLERTLAGLWADLLGLESVGVRDSFFQLGGHSLLATQMIARVHEDLGAPVSLRRFWDQPTILGLVAEIDAVTASASVSGAAGDEAASAGAARPGAIRRRSRGGRGFDDLRANVDGPDEARARSTDRGIAG